MNILMLEDDPAIAQGLRYSLESEGYTVTHCATVTQALETVSAGRFDLCLLDLTLPDGSGYDVCKAIKAKDDTPVIFLTAFDDEVNVVMGLELGADDYIVKPFSPREVVARIKAVLRRKNDPQGESQGAIVRAGKLSVNLAKYEVLYDGKPVICTPKEVEILNLLISHPGQVFDRETILNKVWGYDYFGDTRAVDTQIKRIRHKLPEDPDFSIKTIYGVGYKFEVS